MIMIRAISVYQRLRAPPARWRMGGEMHRVEDCLYISTPTLGIRGRSYGD
jgi:hypothetical protein